MMQFKLKETKIIKLLLISNDKSNEQDVLEDSFDYVAKKIDDSSFNIIFSFKCKHKEDINVRLEYQATF